MTHFLTENFLLDTDFSQKLYFDYAVNQPIFDYHCHLPPEQIAVNYKFKNLYDIWLKGDHYKWRAMRTHGVSEQLCTGDAADYDKFVAWAKTVPHTIGNPLYHWTHLELRRPFGITDTLLSGTTADTIWNRCNAMLEEDSFNHYIAKLGQVADINITSFSTLCEALKVRIDYFAAHGCKVSDHALDVVLYAEADESTLTTILNKRMQGCSLSQQEIAQFKTAVLLYLGAEYSRRDWVQQYHIGAMRNNNTAMFNQLGPDTGFDSINDQPVAQALSHLLNAQARNNALPKTILYCLNPRDNEVIATMLGNFQQGGVEGKMQFGSGWWFNDQKDGMLRQMTQLSQLGLLSHFVGMLTDSRSFLSYTRHEYFRRLLCQMVGHWVRDGEAPADINLLGEMVANICFDNAKKYFAIELN